MLTEAEIVALFRDDDVHDEFLKFERVVGALSKRPDLHAFTVLDKLVPGSWDIVSHAEHDEIWLAVSVADLAAAGVAREFVIDLIRCGVREDDGDLCMFV